MPQPPSRLTAVRAERRRFIRLYSLVAAGGIGGGARFGDLDTERARHLAGPVADRGRNALVARDSAEQRPGELRPAHLEIGDRDHLAGRAEPGAAIARQRPEAADDDLRLQRIEFERASGGPGRPGDRVREGPGRRRCRRGSRLRRGCCRRRFPHWRGRKARRRGCRRCRCPTSSAIFGWAALRLPASSEFERVDQGLALGRRRGLLVARATRASRPTAPRKSTTAADEPPAVAGDEAVHLLLAELLVHFPQERLTVVRLERQNPFSTIGKTAPQLHPSNTVAGARRRTAGARPAEFLSHGRRETEGSTSCGR